MTANTFHLSASLQGGHDNSVRSVSEVPGPTGAPTASGPRVASGSYDNTVRVWRRREGHARAYEVAHTLTDHSRYVYAVCSLPPSAAFPGGLFATAGLDKLINVYSPDDLSGPLFTLLGHEHAVEALAAAGGGGGAGAGGLISGSWDHTARVWAADFTGEATVLRGHTGSVHAVLAVPEAGAVLTGAADSEIRRWNAATGACEATIKGHRGPVRSLDLLPGIGFASCSNDCSVRLWTLGGECVQELVGHTQFVYSVCSLAAAVGDASALVSAGEDRCVKFWRDGECVQTVTHPAGVWSVRALSNGDVVTGCQDGVVRVFTTAEERRAEEALVRAFHAEVSAQSISSQTDQLGGLDEKQIRPAEELGLAGSRDGETKLVRRGASVEAHRWSASDAAWVKIGDVVGQAPGGKKKIGNKEYDYVFDVEFDEGQKYQLGHNDGENPWESAQRFIHENMLGQHNLEDIVAFVEKNTRTPTIGAAGAPAPMQNPDPFTGGGGGGGGGRGAAASAATPLAGGAGGAFANVDPFTASASSASAGAPAAALAAAAAAAAAPAAHFPNTAVATFDKESTAGMFKKLTEFNVHADVATAGQALGENEVQLLDGVMATLRESAGKFRDVPLSTAQYGVVDKLLGWPPAQRFPAVDLMRLALLHRPCAEHFAKTGRNVAAELVDGCGGADGGADGGAGGWDGSAGTLQMLALRGVANAFRWPGTRALAMGEATRLLPTVGGARASGNRNVRLALASVLLNVAASVRGGAEVAAESERRLCQLTAEATTAALGDEVHLHAADPDVAYRLLVALGTLVTRYPAPVRTAVTAALRLDTLQTLAASGVPRVAACARHLGAALEL